MDRVRALLRTRNDYVVPPVTSDDPPIEVTNAEGGKVRTLTPRERDAEIARLERMSALREGLVVESDKEWWERAKEQRDKSGSYQSLESALNSLMVGDRHFIESYYSNPGLYKETPYLRLNEARIVRDLARKMPARIELPHGLYYQHSQKLVAVVKSLSSRGMKARDIGRHLGLGKNFIKRLLKM